MIINEGILQALNPKDSKYYVIFQIHGQDDPLKTDSQYIFVYYVKI